MDKASPSLLSSLRFLLAMLLSVFTSRAHARSALPSWSRAVLLNVADRPAPSLGSLAEPLPSGVFGSTPYTRLVTHAEQLADIEKHRNHRTSAQPTRLWPGTISQDQPSTPIQRSYEVSQCVGNSAHSRLSSQRLLLSHASLLCRWEHIMGSVRRTLKYSFPNTKSTDNTRPMEQTNASSDDVALCRQACA